MSELEDAVIYADLWRKPWAVVSDEHSVRVRTRSGRPRPSFTKALEILDVAVLEVVRKALLPTPIIGLYFESDVSEKPLRMSGVHAKLSERHIIALRKDVLLERPAFATIDLVMHELAHYEEEHVDGGSAFERERHRIARKCAPVMYNIIQAVEWAQERPMRRGRYWK